MRSLEDLSGLFPLSGRSHRMRSLEDPLGLFPLKRKKPQSVLAQAEKAEAWKDRKHRFLQETYDALCRSWDADSMAWVNLHVAAYFYEFTRVMHPRQLAACSLRSSSNESHRWSCWSCQLFPEEAQAAGLSPSKSCWVSDTKQLYHWYQTHAKASHWTWIHEAEELCISHAELMTFLLACDISQWPLPWTQFALGAIPRELPRKASGHNHCQCVCLRRSVLPQVDFAEGTL